MSQLSVPAVPSPLRVPPPLRLTRVLILHSGVTFGGASARAYLVSLTSEAFSWYRISALLRSAVEGVGHRRSGGIRGRR